MISYSRSFGQRNSLKVKVAKVVYTKGLVQLIPSILQKQLNKGCVVFPITWNQFNQSLQLKATLKQVSKTVERDFWVVLYFEQSTENPLFRKQLKLFVTLKFSAIKEVAIKKKDIVYHNINFFMNNLDSIG